jgi:hypothetical protein
MEDDPEIRCGVLCAEGRNFTARLELNQVAKHLAESPLFPADSVDPVNLHGSIRAKPLVSAVQGICFTLGIELMLASDIVVAASDCRFAQIEVKHGIMPSAGATIRMTEPAGLGNALRYLLTGDEFTAETALRLGFIQEVVAPGSERQRAIEIATLISQQAPLAVARPWPMRGKPRSKGRSSPRLSCKRSSAGCKPRKTRLKASAVSSKNGRPNSWGADLKSVTDLPSWSGAQALLPESRKNRAGRVPVLLKIQRAGSGCRGGVLPPGVVSSAVLLNMAKVM